MSLKTLEMFDQKFQARFQQRVVTIDGKLCQMFTLGDQLPGTFGLRIKIGSDAHVNAINNLPFKECECDSTYAKSHDGMMPPPESNPCWTNLHFHGFWGSAEQDDTYACIKPGESKLYTYSIAKCHPTGIFIIHPHNFSSSTYISEATSFPVQIYNPKEPDYPPTVIQEILSITLNYMQKAPPETGAELQVFDFPKYTTSPEFDEKIRASTKLLLTNGSTSPYKEFPMNTSIVLRIAYSGLEDTMNLVLYNDLGERVPYKIRRIDSMPVSGELVATEFLAAHMQRIDIEIVLDRPTQYRLIKYVSPEDEKSNPTTTGTRVLLFINPVKSKSDVTHFELKPNCWIKSVDKKLRNVENIAAWRTIRFNHEAFPEMEGAMMNLDVKPAQIVMRPNGSEVWLVGADDGVHSLHIHLMWFLVLAESNVSPGDAKSIKWKMLENQVFQDTLTIVSPKQYLVWMFPFVDRSLNRDRRATGKAFCHCHKSIHESFGMMLTTFISPSKSTKPSGIGITSGPQSKQILKIVEKSAFSVKKVEKSKAIVKVSF